MSVPFICGPKGHFERAVKLGAQAVNCDDPLSLFPLIRSLNYLRDKAISPNGF